MKNNKLSYWILIIFLLIGIGCKNNVECKIKVKDSQTIDRNTMYAIYTSDTCWEEMIAFTDSITVTNKKISDYNMAIFIYPENKIPKFEENSFAVDRSSSGYYVIMEVFDSSQTGSPHHIIKYPERFVEAKNKGL